MAFLLGLSVGSVLGFVVACFCSLAARKTPSLPAETFGSAAVEEVA